MVLYEEWFDKVKLMHLDRYPDITNSENGPLFTAYFYTLYSKRSFGQHPFMYQSMVAVNPSPGVYMPSGAGGEHFSHDNMTGLYAMYYMAFKRVPSHLPLVTRYVKHPRDILFFMYCKTLDYDGFLVKVLQHALLAFPCLAMIISCMRKFERDGTTWATSTKLLAFLRCNVFRLNKTMKLCTYFLKRHKMYKGWGDIFAYYFRRKDHPCNTLSSLLGDF